MKMYRSLTTFALCLCAGTSGAGEAQSPEQFMRNSYGWTIEKLDEERGMFGQYRNFTCFDDRLAPPSNADQEATRRWGTACHTKRNQAENLSAMIFVTWVNPKHPKRITSNSFQQEVANLMANDKNAGAEPICEKQPVEPAGKQVDLYDCKMVLPFGTFFASYLHFQQRGVDFFVRAANASNTPDAAAPKDTIRQIYKALSFSQ